MSTTPICPECGLRVPPDAPLGLCPRCLMNASPSDTATYRPAGVSSDPVVVGWSEQLTALCELQLVSDEDLTHFADVAAGDPSRLARVLVQAKKLTPYQAGAILQGKARGLSIGDYLVLEKLGAGGMGVVFKAKHRASERIVALKILPPSFGRDPNALRRFRREFQVATRLNHPNLVAAIEANVDRGVHYLTMEYIPGCDLDTLVQRGGPMAIKLALHCAIQAARGLEAAHAQGVIHRDVKPGNIMIDPAGTVRVLDLGLARVIEQSSQLGRTVSGSLTHSGAYMGTVDFLAPEQADDAKSADVRADVYSLGCTLFFLLTGAPPFQADTVLKRLMAHQDRPAPSLRAARPDVPEALEDIYLRMMSKRPSDRPATMSQVILALESCRASAREAGDASAELKEFARTTMKRAAPRGRRAPDASVFAREAPRELTFDPDLRLEDLVTDFRPEGGHGELTEEQLPPVVSRPLPKRVRRRRSSPPYVLVALALIGLAGIVYRFWPTIAPAPVARRPLAPTSQPAAKTAAIPAKPNAPLPSAPVDLLQSGTEWEWQSPGVSLRFTILERQGESFRARLKTNRQLREINGTIKSGQIAWRAQDVRAIVGKAGDDNRGELRGEELFMSYFDRSTGAELGRYQLRLKKSTAPTAAGTAEAFRPLFDGKDLNGWMVDRGDPAIWSVEGAAIVARSKDDWRKMSFLLSDQDYSDFILRLQFQLPSPSDSGVVLRAVPGGNHIEVNLRNFTNASTESEALHPQTGALHWSIGGRGTDYSPPSGPTELRPNGEWNDMEIILRGESLSVSVNGRLIQKADFQALAASPNSLPDLKRKAGRIGFQSHTGTARFRDIQISELVTGANTRTAASDVGKGRRLYSDDFTDPSTGWSADTAEEAAKQAEHHRAYVDGKYRLDANAPASYSWHSGHEFDDVYCETLARVLGDRPDSRGSALIEVVRVGSERGFQVRLTNQGEIFLEPSFRTAEKHPNAPRVGPIRPAALRTGGQDVFHRIGIHRVGRTVDVFVDGTRVVGPVELDWEGPAGLLLGVAAEVPNIRAEYDRLDVWSDSVRDHSPGTTPVDASGRKLNLDFETGTLQDWTAEGNAFQGQPIQGDTIQVRRDDMRSGHQGNFWVGTYEHAGDPPQGTLTSAAFRVTQPFASFLIAGGVLDSTCVELVRKGDGQIIARRWGRRTEELNPVSVDLRRHLGEEIFIRVFDRHGEVNDWAHINFDDFRLHPAPEGW